MHNMHNMHNMHCICLICNICMTICTFWMVRLQSMEMFKIHVAQKCPTKHIKSKDQSDKSSLACTGRSPNLYVPCFRETLMSHSVTDQFTEASCNCSTQKRERETFSLSYIGGTLCMNLYIMLGNWNLVPIQSHDKNHKKINMKTMCSIWMSLLVLCVRACISIHPKP